MILNNKEIITCIRKIARIIEANNPLAPLQRDVRNDLCFEFSNRVDKWE